MKLNNSILVAMLTASSFFMGCKKENPPNPLGQEYIIQGTIFDQNTGNPVDSAAVTFYSYEQTWDSHGNQIMAEVVAGHTLMVSSSSKSKYYNKLTGLNNPQYIRVEAVRNDAKLFSAPSSTIINNPKPGSTNTANVSVN